MFQAVPLRGGSELTVDGEVGAARAPAQHRVDRIDRTQVAVGVAQNDVVARATTSRKRARVVNGERLGPLAHQTVAPPALVRIETLSSRMTV